MAVIAVLIGTVIELILCGLVAILAGKGSVAEESFPLLTIAISGLSVAAIVAFIWYTVPGEWINLSAVCSAAMFGVQILCGLLFWGVEWMPLLIHSAAVIGLYLMMAFMLSRQKKSNWTGKKKKRFC